MRVKLLRGIFWKGKHLKPGDVIEVSQGEYATLVAMNAVEAYAEPIKPENPKIEETIIKDEKKGGKK